MGSDDAVGTDVSQADIKNKENKTANFTAHLSLNSTRDGIHFNTWAEELSRAWVLIKRNIEIQASHVSVNTYNRGISQRRIAPTGFTTSQINRLLSRSLPANR